MRGVRRVRTVRTGVVVAAVVLAVAALPGCAAWTGGVGEETGEPTTTTAPTRPSGYGTVFLGVDECSSFGTTSFTEVPCAGERAAARVVARHDGRAGQGPLCPPTTDFVLHISESRSSSGESDASGDSGESAEDEDGDGSVPRGYACMRKLQAPHPGDPGGGRRSPHHRRRLRLRRRAGRGP